MPLNIAQSQSVGEWPRSVRSLSGSILSFSAPKKVFRLGLYRPLCIRGREQTAEGSILYSAASIEPTAVADRTPKDMSLDLLPLPESAQGRSADVSSQGSVRRRMVCRRIWRALLSRLRQNVRQAAHRADV
jgi:hypothetical protein